MAIQIDELRKHIQPLIDKARTAYNGFSSREQFLLLGGSAALALILLMAIIRPIQDLFSEQAINLAQAEQNVRDMAASINRYQRLVQRRNEIEKDFQSVEIKQGASHLEGLLRDRAGIERGSFNIKEQNPKPFGNNYQQTFFSVTFATTDYARLIDFFQELVDGAKPLMVKRLDIKRSRSGDRLDVTLEVSSITRERA